MNQKGIIPGKLNGQIAALTPTGCRSMISSIPGAISSEMTPCIIMGMPQATSTFSTARRISALASSNVLPHSIVIVRAISSKFASSKFFSLKRYWIRSGGGMLLQPGSAADAAWTAWSTSAFGDKGVRPSNSAVAGLITSTNSVAREGCQVVCNIVQDRCFVCHSMFSGNYIYSHMASVIAKACSTISSPSSI